MGRLPGMRFLSGGMRRINNTVIKHGTIKLLVQFRKLHRWRRRCERQSQRGGEARTKTTLQSDKPDRWAVNEAIATHPDKMMQVMFLAANVRSLQVRNSPCK